MAVGLKRQQTYEDIIRPHLPDLKSYCLYLTKSNWDADDLYQEVLLRAYRYWMGAGSIQDVRSFLMRVARNLWVDEIRQRARRRKEYQYVYADHSTDVNYVEVRAAVETLHEKLIQRHLEMWLLSEYFGYSMQEIAEQCACSVSAVKSALYRARTALRNNLRQSQSDTSPDPGTERVMERWVYAVMREQPKALVSG